MYTFLTFISLLSLSQAQLSPQALQATIDAGAQTFPPYSYAQGGLEWEGLCATGLRQSPIDLLTAEALPVIDPSFSAVSFAIPQQVMSILNLGIYPLYAANGTVWAVFNDEPVEMDLGEVHYHIPAQHLVNGVRYAAEIHASFFRPANNEAGFDELTITLLFQEGQRSPFFDNLLNEDLVDFYSLLSSPVEDYFYYVGSREVPTPDCYEGILYVVVNQVLEISAEQIEHIRTGPEAIPFAVASGHGLYRETQPLYGRTVYHRVPDAVTSSFLAI